MTRHVDRETAWSMANALAHATPGTCWMCGLADPDASPDDVVHTSAEAVVRLDRLAVSTGHLMVILRGHVERLERLELERWESLQRLGWRAARAVDAVVRPLRVWVAALGAPSQLPASTPHLHLHVIPLFESGEAARPAHVLSWSRGVMVYDDDEARALVRSLRAAW